MGKGFLRFCPSDRRLVSSPRVCARGPRREEFGTATRATLSFFRRGLEQGFEVVGRGQFFKRSPGTTPPKKGGEPRGSLSFPHAAEFVWNRYSERRAHGPIP